MMSKRLQTHVSPDENSPSDFLGHQKTIAGVAVNARDLVPADATHYRYMGSLTTVPCSEGVNWYVLKTPIQVGKKQIKAIGDIMGANNLPTQGLANRLLLAAE